MSISITTMIFMKLLNWKNGMISPKNGSDTMEMIWEASFHRDGVDQVEGFKKKFKSWRNHFIENVRQKISIINWSKMQTEMKELQIQPKSGDPMKSFTIPATEFYILFITLKTGSKRIWVNVEILIES